MSLFDLYLSTAALICFDGDPPPGDPPADPPANPPPSGKTFTQDDVNRFLAEDRRKTEARYKAELSKAEKNYQELLENKNLSDEQRAKLEESLEDVRKQLRTKEQQLAHEKKTLEEQYKSKIAETEQKASYWESLFRETEINRSLYDAAVAEDAFQPNQVVTLIRSNTKLVEDENAKGKYKVVVDFLDIDPATNEEVMTLRTPREAVKRMKELPELYGNLFKSGVVSGIGGSSGTPGTGPNGQVDVRKLTPEQYMKLRKEAPEKLGLRGK